MFQQMHLGTNSEAYYNDNHLLVDENVMHRVQREE